MADNDLKVIVKAKELAVHSFRLTSNSNRYPKKYRHSLCDKIQTKSLEIYELLFEANRVNNATNKASRSEVITKAITYCDELMFFIFKNGASYLGFHTYIARNGKVIRKLKNQNKRNAQRKFLRMAKLVAEGKLSRDKFDASYNAWKNHISHGNCYMLGKAMDEKVRGVMKGAKESG